ncbi:hypothetical protein TWF730_011207 [Orbilia blumenaviensis]|uniref:Uncharacterized protein n=1 Tax=Orbilia blumenaviensis TaxID=1796055 RepID=A0AAV9UJP3_9PEZI
MKRLGLFALHVLQAYALQIQGAPNSRHDTTSSSPSLRKTGSPDLGLDVRPSRGLNTSAGNTSLVFKRNDDDVEMIDAGGRVVDFNDYRNMDDISGEFNQATRLGAQLEREFNYAIANNLRRTEKVYSKRVYDRFDFRVRVLPGMPPKTVQKFLKLAGIDDLVEPLYSYFSVATKPAEGQQRSTAYFYISRKLSHVVAIWNGPDGGWAGRTVDYDQFENEYFKVLYISILKQIETEAIVAVPGVFLLSYVTISHRNPVTIKVLSEILQLARLDHDELIRINKPPPGSESNEAVLWAALYGTPEVRAILKLFMSAPKLFTNPTITSIEYMIHRSGSERPGEELEATMMVYVSELPAPHGSVITQVTLQDPSNRLTTFPGREIFKWSPFETGRPDYIEIYPNGGHRGPPRWEERPSYQEMSAIWYDGRAMDPGTSLRPIRISASRPQQHLVIESAVGYTGIPLRDFIWKSWDQAVGANSPLSYVTFLKVSPRGIAAVEGLFDGEKIQAEGGGLLIWKSKPSTDITESETEEALCSNCMSPGFGTHGQVKQIVGDTARTERHLLECAEYRAVVGMLSDGVIWDSMGRPSLQNIEIARYSGAEPNFAIMFRLKQGDRVRESIRDVGPGRGWNAGEGLVFKVSRSGSGAGEVISASRDAQNPDFDVEVTPEIRQLLKATYEKGLHEVGSVLASALSKGHRAPILYQRATSGVLRITTELSGVEFWKRRGEADSLRENRRVTPPLKSQLLLQYYSYTGSTPVRGRLAALANYDYKRGFPGSHDVRKHNAQMYFQAFLRVETLENRDVEAANRYGSELDDRDLKYIRHQRYPYEILSAPLAHHMIIAHLPKLNANGRIPCFPIILYRSWCQNKEHTPAPGNSLTVLDPKTGGRISRKIEKEANPQSDLRYISILAITAETKKIIESALLYYYGLRISSLEETFALHLNVETQAPKVEFLSTEFQEASRGLGMLGVLLGIPEVIEIQEMLEIYQGMVCLRDTMIKEIYIQVTTKDIGILLLLGPLENQFSDSQDTDPVSLNFLSGATEAEIKKKYFETAQISEIPPSDMAAAFPDFDRLGFVVSNSLLIRAVNSPPPWHRFNPERNPLVPRTNRSSLRVEFASELEINSVLPLITALIPFTGEDPEDFKKRHSPPLLSSRKFFFPSDEEVAASVFTTTTLDKALGALTVAGSSERVAAALPSDVYRTFGGYYSQAISRAFEEMAATGLTKLRFILFKEKLTLTAERAFKALLKKRSSRLTCRDWKILHFAKTQARKQPPGSVRPIATGRDYEIAHDNDEWISVLQIPEITAIVDAGLRQRSIPDNKEWFLPSRVVLLCTPVTSRGFDINPLMGVMLEYYNKVDGNKEARILSAGGQR